MALYLCKYLFPTAHGPAIKSIGNGVEGISNYKDCLKIKTICVVYLFNVANYNVWQDLRRSFGLESRHLNQAGYYVYVYLGDLDNIY